jgi:hypothetical protein
VIDSAASSKTDSGGKLQGIQGAKRKIKSVQLKQSFRLFEFLFS